MSRCLQKEEESKEGQMDQGIQKNIWQRIDSGPIVWIREEEKHSSQIQ